jgi:hypothetical protein
VEISATHPESVASLEVAVKDQLIDLWGSRSYKIAYTAVGGRPEIVRI